MDKKYLETQASVLINLYSAKKFDDVVQKGKVLIKKFPDQIIFYNATALSLSALGKNSEALQILKKALELNPKNINVLNNLGLINSNLNKNKEAREYLEKVISINNKFPDALLNLGNLDLKEGKTKSAKDKLSSALTLSKNTQSDLIINTALGNLNQQLGNFEDARSNFDIVNKINPLSTTADKSISTIHKYLNKDDPHLVSMLKKLEKIKDNENLQPLYFALGKAYEDIKEYKTSFKYIKLGNDIADKLIKYNISKDKKLFFEIKRLFEPSNETKEIDSEKKIIFILGMPRSGTTLVEQIISSHNEVYGAGELSYMEDITKNLINYKTQKEADLSSYFKDIKQFKYEKLKLAQLEYIERLKSHDFKEKIITDKAPLNFRWIGLIKMIFPNSKIIHCERNGMDTCYSNFKNAFSGASLGFCYNLEKLGNYYNMYKDLMSFWNSKFNDQIYNLSYEKLINNKDLEVKNLLKFCELSWDEKCLNPHLNKKTVATASLAQVRTPVYKSSVDKWKNVEDELKDLKNIIL